MPGPFTLVTFQDADGDEFPITLVGTYKTIGDAVADANGVLTKAIWQGQLRPSMPITLKDTPCEWGHDGRS